MSATVALARGYRALQFANSGASGVVITSDSDNDNPGNSTGGGGEDDSSSSVDLIGVAIFMATGVAVIFAVVWATWFLSYISDRLCCCFPWFQPVSSLQDLEANYDRGPVARKARLWGLTIEDRMKILTAFFLGKIFLFDEAMLKSAKKKPDTDNEERPKDDEDEVASSKQSEHQDLDAENGTEPDEEDVEKSGDMDDDNEAKVTKSDTASSEKQATDDDNESEVTKSDTASSEKEATGSPDDTKSDEQKETAQEGSKAEEGGSEEKEKEVLDDADHERICCICLSEYEQGDKLMTGTQCIHKLHFDCCMQWMKKHDHCPYCRQEMLTALQMREQAIETLGESRVKSLGSGAAPPVTEATTVAIPPAQEAGSDEENPAPPNDNMPSSENVDEEHPQDSPSVAVPEGSESNEDKAELESENDQVDLEKGHMSLDAKKTDGDGEEESNKE